MCVCVLFFCFLCVCPPCIVIVFSPFLLFRPFPSVVVTVCVWGWGGGGGGGDTQTDPDLHSLGRVVDKGDPDDLGLGVDEGADVGVEDLDVHA